MRQLYPWLAAARRGLLLVLPLLAGTTAYAQAPAWDNAVVNSRVPAGGGTYIRAMTTDASGNVFVAGEFGGTVYFGSTVLTGTGLFVAKYVPATGTWAWVQRGGGRSDCYGTCIAVSGTSVYVGGAITNTATDDYGVTFDDGAGGVVPVRGRSTTQSSDLVVAKYTDNGSSATLGWVQTGGGSRTDVAYGLAASGTSVYVTGSLTNSRTNGAGVTFGDSRTAGGTQVNGATLANSEDLLLVKYTDNGPSATLVWSQVAGGTLGDYGWGVAVSGSAVYVSGTFTNSSTNANNVVLGGDGTTAGTRLQYGASPTSSNDLLLVKYFDDGPTASFGWSQMVGGSGDDWGRGLAVSGSSVYVTGYLTNTTTNSQAVTLGGSGTVPGTAPQLGTGSTSSNDLLLAKYTDNGISATFRWSQVGGGTGNDGGSTVAVGSNGSVFVVGSITNTSSNVNNVTFGSTGLVAGTAPLPGMTGTAAADWVLARYTDNGSTGTYHWARAGGGTGYDGANGVAVRGQQVLVAGDVQPAFAFGATTVPAMPVVQSLGVLAYLTDPTLTPLAVRGGAAGPALTLYPNPAPGGAATLTGAAPGQAVQVLDALGRVAATTTVGSDGTATLGGLAPGLYLVRVGAGTARLAVE